MSEHAMELIFRFPTTVEANSMVIRIPIEIPLELFEPIDWERQRQLSFHPSQHLQVMELDCLFRGQALVDDPPQRRSTVEQDRPDGDGARASIAGPEPRAGVPEDVFGALTPATELVEEKVGGIGRR